MADEWLRGGARVDTLLQQISAMLNSNEQFEMDDSFQLSFTHVRDSDGFQWQTQVETQPFRLDILQEKEAVCAPH